MTKSPHADGRFAYAVYSDDIRLEVGNKLTLVGVYNADMFVSVIPVFIPRLGVWVVFRSPTGQPLKSLEFKVARGSDVVLEVAVLPEQIANARRAQNPRPVGQDPSLHFVVGFNVLLPPMTIAAPCTFNTTVIADGVEYAAGRLHVGLGSQTLSSLPSAGSQAKPASRAKSARQRKV